VTIISGSGPRMGIPRRIRSSGDVRLVPISGCDSDPGGCKMALLLKNGKTLSMNLSRRSTPRCRICYGKCWLRRQRQRYPVDRSAAFSHPTRTRIRFIKAEGLHQTCSCAPIEGSRDNAIAPPVFFPEGEDCEGRHLRSSLPATAII